MPGAECLERPLVAVDLRGFVGMGARRWIDLGVIQLLRGSTPQTGLPAYYFAKAAEADHDDPDYFFNLVF